MNNDLISIIVPIYGVEKYLRRCVNSIISQTYKNIEILLIDDGSLDGSGKICEEYAKEDNRIKVFHKENGGLSDSRNYAIDRAKGKYITTIDGDDFVKNDYIENLYKLIIENEADISSINRINFFENDANGREEKCEFYNNAKETTIYTSKEYLSEIFKDKLPHEAWGKLYKINLFKDCKYEKGLTVYEDIEFLIRLLKKNNLKIVCNTNMYSYYYRIRENSIMNAGFNSYWNKEIEYYNKLKDELPIEIHSDLDNLIKNKILRNINLITKKRLGYKVFKEELKYFNYFKIGKIKSKKIKLKFILIKLFPRLMYKYLSRKSMSEIFFVFHFKIYLLRQKILGGERHLIFNGPTTGNLGDYAILFAEQRLLKGQKKLPFLVSAIEMNYFFNNKLEKYIEEKDKIYITGGGNTGTLWRNEQYRINIVLDKFYNNDILVFPQTIYYSNDDFGKECFEIDIEKYQKCKKLKFQCRDAKTYDFVKNKMKINPELTKDIALTLKRNNKKYKRKGILFCFRKDFEKVLDDDIMMEIKEKVKKIYKDNSETYIDTVLTKKNQYNNREAHKELRKMLKNFAKSKVVVTDRLHGMIFTIITNTPCIAINNLSGKVKGVYDTLSDTEKNKIIFIENKTDIEKIKILQ